MYDFELHKHHGAKTASSAEIIIDRLVSFLEIDAVLDVGCGDGLWLSVFGARGANTISGVDGPWTDQERLLLSPESVAIKDLSEPFNLQRRYSLALSLEVAEHVDKQSSSIFVDNLIRHSDVILFSAAVPHQGGFRHINEQWQSYWAELFRARGYRAYDPLRSQLWNDKNVHFWYRQNIVLYVNANCVDANLRVSRYIEDYKIQQLPLDIIHPERYEALASHASYDEIAFKPLIKKLPGRTFKKIIDVALHKK